MVAALVEAAIQVNGREAESGLRDLWNPSTRSLGFPLQSLMSSSHFINIK